MDDFLGQRIFLDTAGTLLSGDVALYFFGGVALLVLLVLSGCVSASESAFFFPQRAANFSLQDVQDASR